jgi:hypothetical protein
LDAAVGLGDKERVAQEFAESVGIVVQFGLSPGVLEGNDVGAGVAGFLRDGEQREETRDETKEKDQSTLQAMSLQ